MPHRVPEAKVVPHSVFAALQRRFEEAVRREEWLLDNSRSALIVMRAPEGIVLRMNERARRFIAMPLTEGSSTLSQILVPADRARLVAALDRLAGGADLGITGLHIDRGGGRSEVFDAAFHPRPDNGRITWLVELVESGAEIDERTREDVRLFEVVGNVTDRVLHDLRNLLLPLATHVELAMASVDQTSEAYRSLLDVRAACAHCQDNLTDLADIVRPETTGETVAHVKDVVDRVGTILRYVVQRRARVRLQTVDGTPPIRVPAHELQRFLVSAAAHAADIAGPDAKSLLVAARPGSSPQSVVVEISVETGGRPLGEAVDAAEVQDILRKVLPGVEASVRCERTEKELRFAIEFEAARGEAPPADLRGHESLLLVLDESMARELLRNYFTSKGYVVRTAVGLDDAKAILAADATIEAVIYDTQDVAARDAEIVEALTRGGRKLLLCDSREGAKSRDGVRIVTRPYRVVDLSRSLRALLNEPKTAD